MEILRIHHAVPAFDAWKRAFDSDPLNRKTSGVCRYQIHRSISDPNFVMIDLHFDTRIQAEAFLQNLNRLWEGPARAFVKSPQAWILETIESAEV